MSTFPAARHNAIPSAGTSSDRRYFSNRHAEQASGSTWLRKLSAMFAWYSHAVRDPETPAEKAEWQQSSF